jgi:hypothetical protein
VSICSIVTRDFVLFATGGKAIPNSSDEKGERKCEV